MTGQKLNWQDYWTAPTYGMSIYKTITNLAETNVFDSPGSEG